MALCSNDAKSCYDRIVLIIAALCLCRLGADKALVQSMIGTIHGMRHHVRSTYGESKTSQGRKEWGKPIAGIGQGNGTGPQIWAAVSTLLFQILAEEGFLATIICAMSLHTRSIVGFGFVDDTDLCITATDGQPKTVLKNMQQSLQLWANLLRVTGGALVPEKCFWYFVCQEWNTRTAQWTYTDPDPSHRLQVPDDEGNQVHIPQLKASDARRTLGVQLAPHGNDEVEFQFLVKTSRQWQQSMAKAKVTHSATEFGMQQMILRKLAYPLAATTFTLRQCDAIMRPILAQGLPSAGYVRSFPRAIVHGPWQWGGLNIQNLHTEQVVSHLHTILKFGGCLDNITGSLLQASWEVLLLKAGLSGELAIFPDTIKEYVTQTWVLETWLDCCKANIDILGVQPLPGSPRLRDIELMRLFINHGYQTMELAGLNRCRMYIQATYLSDICTASGDTLEQHLWKQPSPIPSQHRWPITPKPTLHEWAHWQRALQQTL